MCLKHMAGELPFMVIQLENLVFLYGYGLCEIRSFGNTAEEERGDCDWNVCWSASAHRRWLD